MPAPEALISPSQALQAAMGWKIDLKRKLHLERDQSEPLGESQLGPWLLVVVVVVPLFLAPLSSPLCQEGLGGGGDPSACLLWTGGGVGEGMALGVGMLGSRIPVKTHKVGRGRGYS